MTESIVFTKNGLVSSSLYGNVDWEAGLNYAEELKLGTKEYEIIK